MHTNDEKFRLLVHETRDFAIMLLDPDGTIVSWNRGAELIKGYDEDWIVGQNFSVLYTQEDRDAGVPEMNLDLARTSGRFEVQGWRQRKDGSRFWANVVVNALQRPDGAFLGFAKITREWTLQRKAADHIRHLADHDMLTELPNRRSFLARLNKMLDEAAQTGSRIVLVNIDINGLKIVNDRHGHAAGDTLLSLLASRSRSLLEPGEFLSRFGGDEFVACRTFEAEEERDSFVDRLTAAFNHQFIVGDALHHASASLGVAVYPDHADTRDKLLANADLAMYRAKTQQENPSCYFDPQMDEEVRERRLIASSFEEALSGTEFYLVYQPQVNFASGSIVGYEALVRWSSPVMGTMFPGQFIPIAEETGFIVTLGKFILETAVRDAVAYDLPRVSVNVSARQLTDSFFSKQVQEILARAGLPPERLELEVTETTIIRDRLQVRRTLQDLRTNGVRIALDDFGTGYSSIEVLRAFPFDRLKLDRGFVASLSERAQDKAFLATVVTLATTLGMQVVAEGIETEGQYDFLRSAGCTEAQGYLLGRPVPIELLN